MLVSSVRSVTVPVFWLVPVPAVISSVMLVSSAVLSVPVTISIVVALPPRVRLLVVMSLSTRRPLSIAVPTISFALAPVAVPVVPIVSDLQPRHLFIKLGFIFSLFRKGAVSLPAPAAPFFCDCVRTKFLPGLRRKVGSVALRRFPRIPVIGVELLSLIHRIGRNLLGGCVDGCLLGRQPTVTRTVGM